MIVIVKQSHFFFLRVAFAELVPWTGGSGHEPAEQRMESRALMVLDPTGLDRLQVRSRRKRALKDDSMVLDMNSGTEAEVFY